MFSTFLCLLCLGRKKNITNVKYLTSKNMRSEKENNHSELGSNKSI